MRNRALRQAPKRTAVPDEAQILSGIARSSAPQLLAAKSLNFADTFHIPFYLALTMVRGRRDRPLSLSIPKLRRAGARSGFMERITAIGIKDDIQCYCCHTE